MNTERRKFWCGEAGKKHYVVLQVDGGVRERGLVSSLHWSHCLPLVPSCSAHAPHTQHHSDRIYLRCPRYSSPLISLFSFSPRSLSGLLSSPRWTLGTMARLLWRCWRAIQSGTRIVPTALWCQCPRSCRPRKAESGLILRASPCSVRCGTMGLACSGQEDERWTGQNLRCTSGSPGHTENLGGAIGPVVNLQVTVNVAQ